ncbi:hypothetical protein [Natronobeatus ordinarius]|uniref:hypothetical protein n=1 Tax=Natronobeatus ordinarius TaxID=2963433 RepID=UPI0020CEFF50|nr:hypothetical protein [Natronobeatus ordinarius]
MPDSEQQDERLSERVVKEAVSVGMETPMREPILEAVEEADGGPSSGGRRLPLAGALLALGAAVGYLVGTKREHLDSEALSIEDFETPDAITEVAEDVESPEIETADDDVEVDADEESGGSRLRRIGIVLAIVGAIALLRRRFSSSAEEEWEPIEEFEPAVDIDEPSDPDESEADVDEEPTPSLDDETEE